MGYLRVCKALCTKETFQCEDELQYGVLPVPTISITKVDTKCRLSDFLQSPWHRKTSLLQYPAVAILISTIQEHVSEVERVLLHKKILNAIGRHE